MKQIFVSSSALLALFASAAWSGEISAVPGPDDQGGMLMPMVSITATSGPASNPTAGTINVSFNPASVPVLRPLTEWSPGNWFAETASWRSDLSPVEGSVLEMPSANAGNGDLFNNQYGFMFMANPMMGMANVPEGNSLAIRLDSINTLELQSFNYGNGDNRWDQVFDSVGSQVLWNGTMWHNYFTMPASATPGTYTAVFEIFIASTPFTGTTGYAQYDAAALDALKNTNFSSVFVTYDFVVIPEPSTVALLLAAGLFAVWIQRKVRHSRCA